MGFYDNYNFDGLKLLSKIKTNPNAGISEPCHELLRIVEQLKSAPHRGICVAEVGVGFGASALPIVQMLDQNDIYICFDFEDKLKNLIDDLNSGKFNVNCKIVPFGNSTDIWDSYNYNLSELIFSDACR